MKFFAFSFFVLCSMTVLAQSDGPSNNFENPKDHYRYESDFLSPDFHQMKRQQLRELLPDSSLAVFFSAPERNRANDVFFEYHQDPNFYYLSGIQEPNSMLLVFKEAQLINGDSIYEIAYVQNKDSFTELWNGRRMGLEKAIEELQIQKVVLNSDFLNTSLPMEQLKNIFAILPSGMEEGDLSHTGQLAGLSHHLMKKLEDLYIEEKPLRKAMAKLRQDKEEEELSLMRKAIEITCKAQNELMKRLDTSMHEYQSEAIVEYVFKSEGAEYTGFPSIQGSGENSCVLHYTSNRRPFRNGGLLVSDIGAEYHGYTADVTRTLPPSGKFSKEEAAIYNLVLKAQEAGIKKAIVGASFWDPNQIAKEIIAEGLIELGILKSPRDLRKYFMHGTSHYLGLDVHDAGLYGPLTEGQVITVEPGIYIAEGSDCDPKWWNIGVRIEDDILILEEGPENLSAASPRTIEDIEKMMQD